MSPLVSELRILRITLPLLCLAAAVAAPAGYPILSAGAALCCGLWAMLRLGTAGNLAAKVESGAESLRREVIHQHKLASIGQLAAGVAHEINTPLNIILQEAEFISISMDENEPAEAMGEVRESASRIREEAKRCGEITRKMLDFSRKHLPVRQTADLNKLAGDMIALMERDAVGRAVTLKTQFDPDLPRITTDPPLVRQILLNLLNNAARAVPDDGTITVSTLVKDNMVHAVVADNGPGVAPKDRDRVFHPFFTTRPPGQGTGLGLSIGLRIARELGGDITLDSEPGQGAAFTLTLPITPEED